MKRRKRKLKTWSYVDRPWQVREHNLPPYTCLGEDKDGNARIVPDLWLAQDELPSFDWYHNEVPENFRGLCLEVSDHGNVSLLRCFKNGNRREIWGMV